MPVAAALPTFFVPAPAPPRRRRRRHRRMHLLSTHAMNALSELAQLPRKKPVLVMPTTPKTTVNARPPAVTGTKVPYPIVVISWKAKKREPALLHTARTQRVGRSTGE